MTACNSRRTSRSPAARGFKRGFKRGFTLAEALLASVVLAVAVLGISQLTGASSQQAETLRQDARAVALARELMEEIASKPFTDPSITPGQAYNLGPDAGETAARSTWDNVDDYNGFTDTVAGQAGTLKTATGAQVVDLKKYPSETFTRSVAVEYRSTPSGAAIAASDSNPADFALVTVTVVMARGRSVQLTQMFTKTTLAN